MEGSGLTWNFNPSSRLSKAKILEAANLLNLLANFQPTDEEDGRQWFDDNSFFSAKVVAVHLNDKC